MKNITSIDELRDFLVAYCDNNPEDDCCDIVREVCATNRWRVSMATGVETTAIGCYPTLFSAIKAADANAGGELIDDEHGCSDDLYSTSAVGRCYVEDMSTAEYDEDGECVKFPEEVYSTELFYTNL